VAFDEGSAGSGAPARRSPGRAGGLSVTQCNGAVLALLVGDLATTQAQQLRQRLLEVELSGAPIVVDASAATWLSDDVIEVLDQVARARSAAGGELVVVDPPPALALRLRRCGISARVSRITPGKGAGTSVHPAVRSRADDRTTGDDG
jgi:anti-anti-sigma regulatory factor